MLTSAQIKKLPKGTYPNHKLVQMFPKQQGSGKSSRLMFEEKADGRGMIAKVPILKSFFDLFKSKKKGAKFH